MEAAFDITHGYLVGTLIGGAIWLVFFLLRRDLRREMLWMGLILSPAGLSERFFVPIYWRPASVASLIDKVGFGIESIFFSFFFGGIAGVAYEVLARKQLVRGPAMGGGVRVVPLIIFLGGIFALAAAGLNVHLFSLIAPAFVAGIFIAFMRCDLARESFLGGITFAAIYFVLFVLFLALFPAYIHDIYNVGNLWGVYVLGVPLEEILFAFAIGVACAPLYEYVRGYRLR